MANPENLANSFLPQVNHNPDVLSCLANLSNDEVFTPPNVANAMLDMLPQELFSNPEAKFLDPVCKSGVFLREITKRLMQGLEIVFPDMQKRLDHILHNQVYGIAITELTSLLSRRTLYCAKYPNCPFSISHFDNITGNIRYKNIRHAWKNGKCIYCGASQAQYERDEGLESHAYEFIHTDNPQEIFGDMKFDVIIGNPPYQLKTGGSKAQATPIYNCFVEQAKKLNPTYLSMIIPDRWFSGGFGLTEFRNNMLYDKHISSLYIYPLASDCFTGVDIPGGICYFLIDKGHIGMCRVSVFNNNKLTKMDRPLLEENCDIFIKYNEGISIIRKIIKFNEHNIVNLVSSQRPFGLATNFKSKIINKSEYNKIRVFGRNRDICFINEENIKQNNILINCYKVFIPAAYGERISTNLYVIGKPFIGNPYDICTETYIVFGPCKTYIEAYNLKSYITTKFFRFLVLLHKSTQHTLKTVYSFVPLQDFSKSWTDAELYTKYNLSKDEINYIESMIRPMDLDTASEDEEQDA